MLMGAYARASSHVFESIATMSRATIAALGLVAVPEMADGPARIGERIEPGATLRGWQSDGPTDGDLDVGTSVTFAKTIREADVQRFAAASGDTNPLHLDEDFARATRFSGRIAHGTLVSGLISAALARLPGVVVYLSQNTEFLAPVRIQGRVTAECEIVEDLGADRYRLRTTVTDGTDDEVIDGEAVVLIDDQPNASN